MAEKMTEAQRYTIVDFIKVYGAKHEIDTTETNASILKEGFLPKSVTGTLFIGIQTYARKHGFRAQKQSKPKRVPKPPRVPKIIEGKRMVSFELDVQVIGAMDEAIKIESGNREKKVTKTEFLTEAIETHINKIT